MTEYELYELTLEDGRVVSVIPLTFGRGRICLSMGNPVLHGYEDTW